VTISSDERSSTVLAGRFVAVEEAVDRALGRIPPEVRSDIADHLTTVSQRLTHGVDQTVVALVGGTGSGKSSLFNAITGIDFADVGVERPTTSRPIACVWGENADPLLDRLGIDEDCRYQRESELDIGTQDEFRGLVLVDVPDHDSIAEEHREYVDTIVPLADVLIWVLDPQKYADAAVHRRYLQQLHGHERSLMAVLNKLDTVPEVAVTSLLADVGRLLTSDGLKNVPVRGVSTKTGEGVLGLRDVLAQLAQSRSAAAVRAAADLHAAAELLSPTLGTSEPVREDLPIAAAAALVAESAEVAKKESAVRQALTSAKSEEELPHIPDNSDDEEASNAADAPIDTDLIDLAKERITDKAGANMPELWQKAIVEAPPASPDLARELNGALRAVPLPTPPRGLRLARTIFSSLFLALAGLSAVWTLWVWLGPNDFAQPPAWKVPMVDDWLAPANLERLAVPVAALIISLIILVIGHVVFTYQLRVVRDRRIHEYGDGLRAAAASLVGERIVGPVTEVFRDHKAVREAIARAGEALSGSRAADVMEDQDVVLATPDSEAS